MKDLEVLDLYNHTSQEKATEFIENVDSSLRVQTDRRKTKEDTSWIDIMEQTIPYIDNIFRNPNRFIINEEEIVKIELARKITVESIKHLSKNTNLIQDFDKETGDVRPSKILNINKEECYETYENRFIYSLVQNMKFFISRKKKSIDLRVESGPERNDKKISYNATSKVANEKVNINVELNSKVDTGQNEETQGMTIGQRIERLEHKIVDLTCSEVYKIIDKKHMSLVTSPIKKTNVILKNVNFQYAMKLWNYLQSNLDDKTEEINETKDYMDNEILKNLVNETFLLQYLALNTLEKGTASEEEQEEIKTQSTQQLVETIISLNGELSKQELKDMIANKYTVIKYRNLATISEIQKIFDEHINKYLKKIKG